MPLDAALHALRRDPVFMSHVTEWRQSPARPAQLAPFPRDLDPQLAAALRRSGIDALYSHQAAAWSAAQAGQNFVVVTPTASGKTWCYNLPVAQALLLDPGARALYLFPTKALAQDQLAELARLQTHLSSPLHAAAYDGDTPVHTRARIRRDARLLLSNPDMLHAGILPHHPQWAELLAGLRYVVLDELHTYRGVFGSHVANVLRRLRRLCRFYGSDPQFLCTSATLANPRELAERLLHAPVALIDQNGAPEGERHFVFYNPPVVDPQLGLRRSSLLEAERIAAGLLDYDVQTVVFARSRLSVEVLLTYLRERWTAGAPAVSPPIAAYRSGYLAAERRSIEAGLRSGALRAVVSTNALELGVNIGGLDAAVLTGFPGAVASLRQQAGRAGRRAGAALAVLVASGGALDQYIIQHPEYVLERSPEQGLINPDNLAILTSHLACAAFELPFRGDERFGDLEFTQDLLAFLAETGEVQEHGGDWFWMGEGYPAQAISLRTASPDRVVIQTAAEAAGRGPAVIGHLERGVAPALLHPGAIYLHQGDAYWVESLDWDAGQATVRPAEVDYYTVASGSEDVHIVAAKERREECGLEVAYGPVQVRSQVTGYRQIKHHTHETLGYGQLDPPMPEQVLDTDAFWLSLGEELLQPLRTAGQWLSDPNDYGPNWPRQRAAARARDGYRCTLCGAPEPPGRSHDVHHRQPFRTFGYVAGQNEAYLLANHLDNLATVCRSCHQRLDQGQRLRTGLNGLAYALHSLAPLHLMCDPGDIGAISETRAVHNGQPLIAIFEKVPAGIGFSQRLYELAPQLLAAVEELVSRCSCAAGCPACVGPVSDAQGDILDAKALVLALAAACRVALCHHR